MDVVLGPADMDGNALQAADGPAEKTVVLGPASSTPVYEATMPATRADQLGGYDAAHPKEGEDAFAKTNVMRNPLADGKGDTEA